MGSADRHWERARQYPAFPLGTFLRFWPQAVGGTVTLIGRDFCAAFRQGGKCAELFKQFDDAVFVGVD